MLELTQIHISLISKFPFVAKQLTALALQCSAKCEQQSAKPDDFHKELVLQDRCE